MKEPKQTCPMIDDLIRELRDLEQRLKQEEPYEDILDYFFSKKGLYSWTSTKGVLVDAIEDIRSANSEIREWGSHWEKEAEKLQEELETAEERIRELENELDSSFSEIDCLKEELSSLESDITGYENEISSLNEDIKSIQQELLEASRRLYTLEG